MILGDPAGGSGVGGQNQGEGAFNRIHPDQPCTAHRHLPSKQAQLWLLYHLKKRNAFWGGGGVITGLCQDTILIQKQSGPSVLFKYKTNDLHSPLQVCSSHPPNGQHKSDFHMPVY